MEIINQYLELVEGVCRRTETFSLMSKYDVISKFYPNNPMSWRQYFHVVQPHLYTDLFEHPIIKSFSEEVELNCYKISKNQEQAVEYRKRLSNTLLNYINPALSALERCSRMMRFSERLEFNDDEVPENFFLWLCLLHKDFKETEFYIPMFDLELDSVGDAIRIIELWKKPIESALSPIGPELDSDTTRTLAETDIVENASTASAQIIEQTEVNTLQTVSWNLDAAVLYDILGQLMTMKTPAGAVPIKREAHTIKHLALMIHQYFNFPRAHPKLSEIERQLQKMSEEGAVGAKRNKITIETLTHNSCDSE